MNRPNADVTATDLTLDDRLGHAEETVTLSLTSMIDRGHLLGLMCIIGALFTLPFPANIPHLGLGFFALVMRPLWRFLRSFYGMKITTYYHMGVTICAFFALWQLYVIASEFPSSPILIYELVAFVLITGATLLTNPVADLGAKIHPVIYFVFGSWALTRNPNFYPMLVMVSVGNYLFLLTATQHFRAYRIRQDIRVRIENLQIAKQNASLSRIKLEKELELAREVQESFVNKKTVKHGEHYSSVFFEKKHGILGGDWMAFRTLDSGDTISVLVDATGKGVAAALVIHAIQSLWADSLNKEFFHPREWILDVNRTLFQLGRRSAHTVTMGVVIISGDILTYYSAGHVPLYLIREVDGLNVVTTLASRGSILGISENILLYPKSIDLISNSVRSILSGTDGVFVQGTRTSPRQVLKLVRDLESKGEGALSMDGVKDDKLLLWMRRVA
jgi:hypothetical protein